MGRHSVGSHIRQEEPAAEFGSSRLPVREALRMLEAEGLVVLVPNSGARVAASDLQRAGRRDGVRVDPPGRQTDSPDADRALRHLP
ncbi:GntR family transcriptional regulator [Streptomyces luteogriseus]|uniref:GntR family transcriptional regulator n=1 Tax=Streptomyces luteogriseus TaxID=68233 RepID=UPI0037B46899